MTAADAPIRAAGGYLPLIFGAVFTWAAAKALLMERRREQDRNKSLRVDFSRKARRALGDQAPPLGTLLCRAGIGCFVLAEQEFPGVGRQLVQHLGV